MIVVFQPNQGRIYHSLNSFKKVLKEPSNYNKISLTAQEKKNLQQSNPCNSIQGLQKFNESELDWHTYEADLPHNTPPSHNFCQLYTIQLSDAAVGLELH